MSIEIEYLLAKKEELNKQLEQLRANANAINGALQLLEHLMEKAKAKAENLLDEAKGKFGEMVEKIEGK